MASPRERFGPFLVMLADAVAVIVAVTMPWSTTATSVCVPIWIVVCIPTLKLSTMRDAFARPAGGFPALLAALGALGMLWADVPWATRLGSVDSFARLLVIPLLLAHFRDARRGRWVLGSFLFSCTVLLVVSWALTVRPSLGSWLAKGSNGGVPVKDYIAQSGEFVLCAFALGPVVIAAARTRRLALAVGLGLLALAFLANVLYVATGRTTLVITVALLVLFCLRHFPLRGALATLAAAAIVGAAVWASSPYLRMRITSVIQEVETYRTANAQTSAGERLEFWRKSIAFLAEAPVVGHGMGSIAEMFRRSTVGQAGPGAEAANNPHNQTFTVALQLGLVGTALLYGMWMAHLLMFRGPRLAAWIGLVIVVEDIVGSVFNSYLFDFTQAWIYIFGVGVAGGMVLPPGPERPKDAAAAREAS